MYDLRTGLPAIWAHDLARRHYSTYRDDCPVDDLDMDPLGNAPKLPKGSLTFKMIHDPKTGKTWTEPHVVGEEENGIKT